MDVEDSKGNWFPGKVVDMDDAGGRAKVHYNGYACVCVCVCVRESLCVFVWRGGKGSKRQREEMKER